MGTLYAVGIAQGDPEDLTLRTMRILGQVALVVAEDVPRAGRLLAAVRGSTSLPALVEPAAQERVLAELARADVALLVSGLTPAPTGAADRLIAAAIAAGYPVAPVPGPSLPVTALVLSGLPSDSFIHLGCLPGDSAARRTLLAAVAGEPRTLVALVAGEPLSDLLADLHELLGDRTLAVTAVPAQGGENTWRGTVAGAADQLAAEPIEGVCVLVIGGAPNSGARWSEERLHAEIRALRQQGLGSRQIGAQLSAASGWSRREIYRLAVAEAHPAADG